MNPHTSPIKLLLVEDNPGDALLVQGALETQGGRRYTIIRAASLEAARAALGAEPFDAILLDLSLPDSRGTDTIAKVHGASNGAPIVVLSGAGDEEEAMEAVRRGADDYLVKGMATGRGIARAVRYAIDRRHAQERLRQSEERYRTLLEFLPAATYTCDREGRITLYNQQAAALWGRQPALERERWFGSERLFHPDGRPMARDQCPMARTIRDGRAILGEEVVVERPDGSRVHVMPYPQLLFGADGDIVGGVNVLVDITTLRQTQEDLRRLNESLEQRITQRTAEAERRAAQLREMASQLTLAEQRERKRLAQVLHDDLQQLLVAAKFRVSALERSKDKGVRSAALLVSDLISQSIASSRTLTGELFPPILHDGGLVPALHWLARWMNDKHGLTVTLEAEDGADPAAEGVKVLMFQGVRELLFNIVKHAGVRHAQVRACRVDGLVQITVADHGAGFDPARLHVGHSMTHGAPGAIPGASGGTGGFGLRSVRERLALLGGHLEVDSAPGHGSRFTLVAPLHQAAAPGTPPPAPGVSGVGEGTGGAPGAPGVGIKKTRILIADDHAVMRQGLNELFKNEPDLSVVGEACDGQMAIHLARQLRPDVVVMDVSIPGVNGIEATRLIRAELPGVKVIGLSMYEQADRAAAMHNAGAAAYLTKSGPAGDLIAAVRACAQSGTCPSPRQDAPGVAPDGVAPARKDRSTPASPCPRSSTRKRPAARKARG